MWLKILNFFLSLPEKVKTFIYGLGGLVALASFIKVYLMRTRKEAVKDYKQEAKVKNAEAIKDAKEIGYKEKKRTDGLSDGDIADRLRRRSDDWSSL